MKITKGDPCFAVPKNSRDQWLSAKNIYFERTCISAIQHNVKVVDRAAFLFSGGGLYARISRRFLSPHRPRRIA